MTVAELYKQLPAAQQERIRLKQRWERCSMLAVHRDWPDMFEMPATQQEATP